MSETEGFFVSYAIDGFLYQAGPYDSREEAEDHRRDIAGYDRIKCCFVEQRRDSRRQLIGEG